MALGQFLPFLMLLLILLLVSEALASPKYCTTHFDCYWTDICRDDICVPADDEASN